MKALLRVAVGSLGLLAVAGCGSDPPVIDEISPAVANQGTAITLRGSGFAQEGNDIAFSLQDGPEELGYLNGVASTDTSTLQFDLPEGLSACAKTQDDEVCALVLLGLPPGSHQVFVLNEDGESIRVNLDVAGTK